MQRGDSYDGVLRRLSDVLALPLGSLVHGLSRLLHPLVPHSAVVMLAADVSGGRLQASGEAAFIRGVRGLELDRLRRAAGGVEYLRRVPLGEGDAERPTLQALSRNGALLVLADPGPADHDELVLDIWNIVSMHVQERADEAAPDYLQHARSTAGSRLKVLTELADEYSTTLESLLALLRSAKLTDAEARRIALDRAADGLAQLHTVADQVRTLTEESVTAAFARLKNDLRPITRYRDVEVQFIEPPADGRPLPGEVAHGARAVVHRVILALIEAPETGRVRVQWDCDGTNLLVDIRDDGPGDRAEAEALLQTVQQRIVALGGTLSVVATRGWGTELAAVFPLDPPRGHIASSAVAGLRPREVQVTDLLVAGYRNRAIAGELGISENTVKFHVSRILQTLGADSRAEAIAMLLADQQP